MRKKNKSIIYLLNVRDLDSLARDIRSRLPRGARFQHAKGMEMHRIYVEFANFEQQLRAAYILKMAGVRFFISKRKL